MGSAAVSAASRRRLLLAGVAFLAALALLATLLQPAPGLSPARHWLVFAAYAGAALALMVAAALLVDKRFRAALGVASAMLTAVAALAHPVCVLIPETERPAFESVLPLQARAAQGEPFCQLAGQWYQCKPFVARALFF